MYIVYNPWTVECNPAASVLLGLSTVAACDATGQSSENEDHLQFEIDAVWTLPEPS